jgi:hypothetical protein
MTFSFSDFSSALKSGATLSAEDVLALRRAVWPDGAVARSEAEAIFDLHRLTREPGLEWGDFFIEAISDHVLNGTEPRGYVDDETAAWLIARIGRGGEAIGPVDLELVVRILEKAVNAPASLKAWALAEIERCVLHGTGATRRDGDVRPGVIDEAEVGLLRRIVFAAAGDGALVVSREEAEMLWRIKDSTLGAANAPGWQRLFVQAVGNHLMAWSGYRPLERTEAARLETFMNDRSISVVRFLSRMRGSPDFEGAKQVFEAEGTAEQHQAAVDAAEAVTPTENAWLQSAIARDDRRDECEEALIRFLEEEGGSTPR